MHWRGRIVRCGLGTGGEDKSALPNSVISTDQGGLAVIDELAAMATSRIYRLG